jgi:putative ATPase
MNLFEGQNLAPLAERVRPKSIEEMMGQQELTGPNGPFRKFIEMGKIPSIILWGPPGTGKTTLAMLLAHSLKKPIQQINAVQAGIKEIREVIAFAKIHPGTILFIDEIHRFNKSQQDALLNVVEKGLITLIGATTENPSFEVIPALMSRCQVYVLESLSATDIHQILTQAIKKDSILTERTIQLQETEAIYQLSGGDARRALNLLELVVQSSIDPVVVTNEWVMQLAKQKTVIYDKQGEQHYDIISAFIKSVRGNDPNGAVYWLARMLEAGEDVKFIARRLLILASEDIGNANPNALLLAHACFQSVSVIGMPEARIILSQTTTYLACSLKSNAAYQAIDEALAVVRNEPNTSVPLHLRNAPTKFMKNLGYGKDYKYTHAFENPLDAQQEYLPEGLEGRIFYKPKNIGKEIEMQQFLKHKWKGKYKYE